MYENARSNEVRRPYRQAAGSAHRPRHVQVTSRMTRFSIDLYGFSKTTYVL